MGTKTIIILSLLIALSSACLAQQQFASLIMTSEPAHATVILNGNKLGTTPVGAREIKPGTQLLVVLKKGYRPFKKELTFEAGKTIVDSVTLTPVTLGDIDLGIWSMDPQDAKSETLRTRDTSSTPEKNEAITFVKEPTLITKVEPVYPDAAELNEITGKVYVQILVDTTGLALRAEIAKSSGSMSLDYAAIEAAYQWKFTPAIAKGNIPTRVWIMQPFTFLLHK